ncbi:RNA-binding protein [Thraustotheca clavata]|uniref:RNA-binding protein n=1 Tax=Thraustotheca clavata TaxID=74557 RepID=A0A1W0A401_9STRA|nr:RNA-binding protein [Thraustotheca clavata]
MDADAKELLSEWLVRTLEPLCDADPVVLSKYVLALVQNHHEKDGLRATCMSKLDEFLGDETPGFVDRLFTALHSKSYMHKQEPAREREVQLEDELDDRRTKRMRRSRSRSRSKERDARDRRPREYHRYVHIYKNIHCNVSSRRDMMVQQPGRGGPMPMRRGARFDSWNMPPPQMQQQWGMYPPRPMYPPMMDAYDPRRKVEEKPNDLDAATLRVDNVDPKFINVTKLSAHFSKFGDVVNIQMRPQFKCAFVQFASVEMAKRAFHSPIPVCNNRFISVHFAKHAPKDLGDIPPENIAVNPEARRQEMLEQGKKILEEKRQLLEQDKALQAQREALMSTQLEQTELLLKKLEAKNMLSDQERTKLESKIDDLKTQLQQLKMPPLERLQQELQALEHQEKQLKPQTQWKKRVIDNRTRWIHLTVLPEAARDKSVLEQHFAPFGAIDQVIVEHDSAFVQFQDRYAGEKALKFGQTYMETPLTMAWSEHGPELNK